MRDISNNTRRLLAEKIINDVLFMAEMGQLTLSHSIRGSIVTNNEHVVNNDEYPQAGSNCYQGLYPETLSGAATNSENSNQSLTSYVTNFSDT
ncbi:hypothetical protein R5R35_011830 [Gryllus longicercus]|uniref:Uncharacterized protein n=1 Tax=Gryllus longicercus TaxID=2509291 RepID=A0AAN9W0H9_9ORTH